MELPIASLSQEPVNPYVLARLQISRLGSQHLKYQGQRRIGQHLKLELKPMVQRQLMLGYPRVPLKPK